MSIEFYLLPPFCTICQTKTIHHQHQSICDPCYMTIKLPDKKCIFCDTFGVFLCHFCKKIFPKLECTSIAFRYDAGIRSLLQQLKFSLKPYTAKVIAEIIWEKHHEFILSLPSNTTIIPMPSGRLRIAKRGYNPVTLIARELAKLSKLSFAEHYLLKSAFSIPQVELSRQERLDNHHNSFRLNPSYQDSQLPIENILLIDDVITTGRSFEKAVEKLHESSAKQIFGLLIAQS